MLLLQSKSYLKMIMKHDLIIDCEADEADEADEVGERDDFEMCGRKEGLFEKTDIPANVSARGNLRA